MMFLFFLFVKIVRRRKKETGDIVLYIFLIVNKCHEKIQANTELFCQSLI